MTENQIELNVSINGLVYPVRCDLPTTMLASCGPLSVRSALEPCVRQLLDRMVEMLDKWMPHPRVATWNIEHDHDRKPSA